VGYDGGFCFSFFERLHVFRHYDRTWTLPPEREMGNPVPEPVRFDFKPLLGREDFLRMVVSAQNYIAAGDIYQVCLSHPFVAERASEAWNYYECLRRESPAPHAAFLDGGDVKIASASPECFLRLSGRHILTRPIKGTRPRGRDFQNDQRRCHELTTSAKEIAELIMITDLERNDLGRVCDYGSVAVPDLLRLEKYKQVFHLVSTVTGQLRLGVGHVEALRACFPGGSITGAPKKRAMEIIAELEAHPRGLYTGAIGYFGYNGESQFSIAIRTAVFEQDRAHFHVGAGIVADSQPDQEWRETWHKAAGLLLAAGSLGSDYRVATASCSEP
jgi:aminodeoxychorismate synthase component I